MKILVLSMLRIGDTLMLEPLFKALKKKYPGCDLDILVNDSVAPHLGVLKSVGNLIEFDRSLIQSSLGESSRFFFEGYSRVSGLVGDLNKKNYELVVNLTQTRLSGWLMGLINAKEKIGLELQTNGDSTFGSKWLSFLNRYDRTEVGDYFHYLDIFSSALKIKITDINGPSAADRINGPIAIQALTSDSKKNWETSEWVKFFKAMRQNGVKNPLVFVCAPFELESVNKIRSACAVQGLETDIFVGSILEVANYFSNCYGLVSLDTSIKHLAVTRVPKIIELCFGSSNPHNTGATQSNTLVMRQKVTCGPCKHSTVCPYESRSCAKTDSYAMGAIGAEYLLEHKANLRLLAKELDSDLEVLISSRDEEGLWKLAPVLSNDVELYFDREINKRSWKFFLNDRHLDVIGEYGSEGMACRDDFSKISTNYKNAFWSYRSNRVKELKKDFQLISKSCELVHKAFLGMNREKSFEKGIWELVEVVSDSKFVQTEYPEMVYGLQQIKNNPDQRFFNLRKMQIRLNDILAKESVRIKLLDSVYNQCLGEV